MIGFYVEKKVMRQTEVTKVRIKLIHVLIIVLAIQKLQSIRKNK